MQPKKSKTWLWILLAVLIVLIAAGAVYYFKFYQKTAKPTASPTPTTALSPTASAPVTDPGVTWITPEVLGDLSIIKTGIDTTGIAAAKYYKIANLADGGELILVKLEFDGPTPPVLYRFKKDSQGKYSYLLKVSSEKDPATAKLALSEGVTIDENTTYQALSAPDTLTVKDTTLKSTNNVGFFSDLNNPLEVGDTAYGKLYKTKVGADATAVGGVVFSLKLVDTTYRNYGIKPAFMTDDEVAQITWSDGTKNSLKFTAEGYVGCGMTTSSNVILKTDDIGSRLTEAGPASTGDKIYTVSKDDPVMTMAYENYKTGRTSYLSLEDFVAQKPVFIWQDGLNDYIIFTGRDFAGLAECGKPVIYLYPTEPTKVTVKVGAKITNSEPLYNNGWEAMAYPSGKLNVAGKIYDYLFWEGTGQEYPIINAGTVVRKVDLPATLEKQLGELGLNAQEKADFLEFWLAKMPETPFVRLTWLGTSQMNRLAPLSVSPAPETMIRIFLDFEGLSSPINIPAQNLSAPLRRGFTLVEWGGLLRK